MEPGVTSGAKLSLCRVPGALLRVPSHTQPFPARSSHPDRLLFMILSCSTAPGAAACHSTHGPSHHPQDSGIPEYQGSETQSYKSRLKYPQSLESLEKLSASDLTKALLFGTVSQSPTLWQMMNLADIELRLFFVSLVIVLRCLNSL